MGVVYFLYIISFDNFHLTFFPAAKDRYGRTLMHLAILYGHSDMVKFMIDQTPDLVKERDNLLRTPLHYAAASPLRRQIYGPLVNQAGGDATALDAVSIGADLA